MRIQLFGQLRVFGAPRGDLGPRDFPGLKPKQLLAVLAVARGQVVSKSRLADHLWRDGLPRNHRATLETYISVLRQTLEPGVQARESVIVTERGGYRLDTDRVELDLDEFDRLLAEAAPGPTPEALAVINEALRLVGGDVLEDEPYSDWAEAERGTYQQRLVQALIDAARLSLLTGEATAALALAERAVALNPLAEAAYQVLMAAAYSLWRQEEALQAYDTCRRLLAEELGIDPLDETVALHVAILRHEDVASLLPRRPAGFEGAVGRGDRDAAVFLGREEELRQLNKAVGMAAAGRFTVVMVTGEPGIGKTSLVEAMSADSGLPVGYNRCSDLERQLPYLALAMALAPILSNAPDAGLPVLDDLLERVDRVHSLDELARVRAMEKLATAVRGHEPAIVHLDDVQWADADSLTTLNYLRRRCATTPLLVVMTCDRAGLKREELRSLRPDVRIDLDVLPAEVVARLGAYDLYDATRGHPSFVAGWIAARRQALPDTYPIELRERILSRCWDLGPQAYRLLSVASALDGPISPAVLAGLVGADLHGIAEELDRLVEERLLIFVGQTFEFRHPAIRQILSETLSPARRSMIRRHRRGALAGTPRRRLTDVTAAENLVTEPGVDPGRALL